MLNTFLVVGFGGFIGAILRMFSINLVNKFFPYSISLGTLFVNVLGSFIIGLLFSYAQNKGLSPLLKSFISTGFFRSFYNFFYFFLSKFTSFAKWKLSSFCVKYYLKCLSLLICRMAWFYNFQINL